MRSASCFLSAPSSPPLLLPDPRGPSDLRPLCGLHHDVFSPGQIALTRGADVWTFVTGRFILKPDCLRGSVKGRPSRGRAPMRTRALLKALSHGGRLLSCPLLLFSLTMPRCRRRPAPGASVLSRTSHTPELEPNRFLFIINYPTSGFH